MTGSGWVRRIASIVLAAVVVPLSAGAALAGGPGAPQNAPSVLPVGQVGGPAGPQNMPSVVPPAGGQQVPVVSGLTVVDRTALVTVAPRTFGQATAACRSGEERISGGFALTPDAYRDSLAPTAPYDRYPVFANYPSLAAGWTTGLANRTDAAVLLVTHVECAVGTVGTQVVQALPDAADPGSASAACPAGSVVTGGGWSVRNIRRIDDVVSVWASGPLRSPSGEGWRIQSAVPPGSRAGRLQNPVASYTVCAASWLHPSQGASAAADVPAGSTAPTSAQGQAACASTDTLTGAGFALPRRDGSIVLTSFYPTYSTPSPAWELTAYGLPWATGVGGGRVALVPVCDHGGAF